MTRRRMLVLSHVLPFPGNAGQQQRVRETLAAARRNFHVTFATFAPESRRDELMSNLAPLCDDVLILSTRYGEGAVSRAWHHAAASTYALMTGLKSSNYVIGKLEFSPERVRSLLTNRTFDVALFEYWHAANSAVVLQAEGVRCVLDMHDILWKGREQRLLERSSVPAPLRRASVARYRKAEERAWSLFDGVVAINEDERAYAKQIVPQSAPVFYAPMGTDLERWSYRYAPTSPPRIAYYGSLGTEHNQRSAMQCHNEIMPLVWQRYPNAELWLVGGNPSEKIRALASDRRVVVTGFVEQVPDVLATMTLVLCPWRGTYGFRSRLVEVMAVGVPVVASPDAVAGMGMTVGNGLFLAKDATEFAAYADSLLASPTFAMAQSRLARQQMDELFSLDATYYRLMRELESWLDT